MESPENIRLVVCDMDGTFLRPDKSISEANRNAVRAAAEKGIRFSICTGRIQTMTEFYLKDLELDTPVITANGALIWDPVERKSLWDLPMEEEEVLALLSFCRYNKLDYCALTMEESFFSPENVRKRRFDQYNRIAKEHGFAPMTLVPFDENFDCIRGKKVYKILIYEIKDGQTELAEKFLKTLKMTGYTSSEDKLLDIAHKDVNKGYGLVQLARLLNVPLSEVCAVGDYDNDIPMLEVSGFPVAMANGCEAIKKAAAFVTRTNEEDGVAYMFEKFLL